MNKIIFMIYYLDYYKWGTTGFPKKNGALMQMEVWFLHYNLSSWRPPEKGRSSTSTNNSTVSLYVGEVAENWSCSFYSAYPSHLVNGYECLQEKGYA
jgi:hypothetical protein